MIHQDLETPNRYLPSGNPEIEWRAANPQSQGPLARELQKDNTASFHYIQGEVDSSPGPGIDGFYEGPYLSFYKWPRTVHDDEASIMEAYDLLSETIEDEGPFDGILGFSQGGTLAAGFLAHHAKQHPYDHPPFRCAVFISSLPPFQLDDAEQLHFDDSVVGHIKIPTVHVVGTGDFVYNHSLRLYRICDARTASLVVHDKGHEIPGDRKFVTAMTKALRELHSRAFFLS